MGRAVIGDVVGRAVALGLVVLVAALDLGFYAVMGAAAGGALAHAGGDAAAHAPLVRGALPRASRAVWRALLVPALPLGLALAINELYFRADTLIISLYEPYDEVGLYTLAYRILELTLVLGTVFLTTTFPLLSEAVADDEPRARRTIQLSTDLFVVLGVPLVAGGLVLAPDADRAGGRRGLRGRGRAAADPAGRRRAGLGQRRVRLRADRQGAPGQRAVAERHGAGLQRRAELPARAALRHSGGRRRDGRLRGPDPGRLLPPHATLLRLLPRPAHARCPALLAAAVMGGVLWALRDAPLCCWCRSAPRIYAGCCGHQPARAASWWSGCAGERAGPCTRRGPRDTRSWYRDADPMEQVDHALVDFVRRARRAARARPGLRPGRLQQGARPSAASSVRGARRACRSTWSGRAGSACDAELYDGERLPLDDGAVDTVILLEVIEHLEDPAAAAARGAPGGAAQRAA